MSWFTLILFTVLIDSTIILAQKKWATKGSHSTLITGALYQIFTGLMFLLFALATSNFNLSFGLIGVFVIVISSTLYTLTSSLWYFAIHRVSASTATIVLSTRTIFALGLGFLLLGETIGFKHIVGMVLIMVGVIYSQFKDRVNMNYAHIGILLLNALVASFASIVDRVATKAMNLYTYLALAFLIPGLAMLVIQKLSHKRLSIHYSKQYLVHVALVSALFFFSATAYIFGLSIAPSTGLVVLVNQTKIVLTVVLAAIFLHERGNVRQKVVSSILCLGGLYLLN